MALTPNDIRQYEFDTQMRGYNKDEVEDLLEQIARAMEADKQDNLKLSMEVDSIKTQLSSLREFEDSIKNAAIDARRNADRTVEDAKNEAQQMIDEAKKQAADLIVAEKEQLRDLELRVERAKVSKRSYLESLRELMQSHLKILEAIDTSDLEDIDDHFEVTNSSEVERDQMETLADQGEKSNPITTEEANATGKVIPVTKQPDSNPQTKPENDPIDPELAAALANYQTRVDRQDEPSMEPSPLPGTPAVVETNQVAEDIPPGFFAKDPKTGEDITGKIRIAQAVKAKQQTTPEQPAAKVPPAELANQLDKVVAKFEEELDKAAQTE